jgi:hypothetical protein
VSVIPAGDGQEGSDKAIHISLPLPDAEAGMVRRQCDLGEGQMCTLFGVHLMGLKAKEKRIAKFLSKGCQNGDPNGCMVMSQL